MTVGRPGKRSAVEAEQTRDAILQAALNTFSELGFDGASVRDIASHTGVSHGVLRHHFGSKEDLWKHVMEHVFDHFSSHMLPLIEGAVSGDKSLALTNFHSVVSGFIDISLTHPSYARLLISETRGGGERAEYCHVRFAGLHTAISELFDLAKAQSPALQNHSNDSFFYCLMSLTYFRIAFPGMGPELNFPVANGYSSAKDMILDILFADSSVSNR